MINFKKTVSLGLATIMFASATGITTSADLFQPQDFDTATTDFNFSKTDSNNQLVFSINNCESSKEFDFKFPLKQGEKFVSSEEVLGLDTGETLIMNGDLVTGIVEKPWAFSANGTAIPTYYKFDENILTQVVDHKCTDSFPITADPNAWQVTMCVASIASALAGVAIPAAKIVKIKKAIKIVGGLNIFAKLVLGLVLGTQSLSAVALAFGPIVAGAALELLGIDSILKNCK